MPRYAVRYSITHIVEIDEEDSLQAIEQAVLAAKAARDDGDTPVMESLDVDLVEES
jgi:hypothetical protein